MAHASGGGANNMHPLSWERGGGTNGKAPKTIIIINN